MDEGKRKLIKFATALGCIQGVTWIILCIICIVLYFLEPTPDIQSYFDFINTYLYGFLFNTYVKAFPDQVFFAEVFTAFIWIYLILDALWVVISVYNFRQQTLNGKVIKLWCYITATISVWDVITVIIFGSDYSKCLSFVQDMNQYSPNLPNLIQNESICAHGTLIPLAIAAKGFILWIINIACVILLYQIATQSNTPNTRTIPPNVPTTPTSFSDNSWYYKQPPPPQQNPYANPQGLANPANPSNQNFSFAKPDSRDIYRNPNQRNPVQNEPRNQFGYPTVPEPDYGQRWQMHK